MDTALVLRAATCWDAWHDAMARLKTKGLGKEEATKFLEDAYWQLTRVPAEDYARLTADISRHGLRGGSICLHADDWSNDESLMMLTWTPPAGFAHLLSDVGLMERPGPILS